MQSPLLLETYPSGHKQSSEPVEKLYPDPVIRQSKEDVWFVGGHDIKVTQTLSIDIDWLKLSSLSNEIVRSETLILVNVAEIAWVVPGVRFIGNGLF